MLVLNIGNKDYKIEFTIEASLCNECTEKVTNLMMNIAEASGKKAVREVVSSMTDVPQTTMTMFYAGLLEYHGEDGDGTVVNKDDAKKLLKKYFAEHKEDGTGNFYSLMELLIEQMGNDGFFKQIGLEQMFTQAKEVKTPQDHKKKATKATEK